jgi:hypothetical protein
LTPFGQILIHETRASASAALIGALPSSILAVAITNPSAAATIISSEFATGTPTWFTKLPSDVQTYFLTAQGAAVPTAAPTGNNGTLSTATGKFSNSTTAAATSSGLTTKLTSAAASTAATTSAKSSSSTGGAALPTGIVGAGIAGAIGLMGMLAL